MFGSPETTPGGRALKFYSSMRLDVRRVEAIKVGDQNIGNKVKVKVVKNKTAQPFREGFFDIIFGEGISGLGSMIDVAVEMNVLDKSGTWISFGETKMGQGREAAKTFLKEHPEVYAQIEKLVKQKAGLIPHDLKPEVKDAKAGTPTIAGASAAAPAATAKVALTPAGAAALAASKKEAEKVPEKAKVAVSK
jgi:recombination protein RecA